MCGISGIINFHKKPEGNFLLEMNKSIQYRGPDHQAVWSNNFCSIGVVRLKIIDLSDNANQPFFDKEKKVTVIYNGEIYNFKEIKKLYFQNTKFKSKGDGEIILELYKKFGIGFVDKIKGMFAIFICDENNKKNYLIRDRFGIKQLYYNYDESSKELTFCSEIKGLFRNPSINKSINFNEIHKVLNYGLIDTNHETCFSSISKVPNGSYILFSYDKFEVVKYYKLEDKINEDEDKENHSFKFYSSKLKEEIINSFNQHTTFDVKGGIHMSGGCDSAILAALTSYTKKNLTGYTFGFENKNYSEINEAKKLATSVNLRHESAKLLEKDIEDYLFKVIEIQHEPFSSLRVLSQNFLYEKFKKDAVVILDGSGGDEIGAGYRYYILPWYLDMQNLKTRDLDKRFYKTIGKHESLSHENFIKGAMANYLEPGRATQDGSMFEKGGFLNEDFLNKYKTNLDFLKRPFKSHLRNAQYLDFNYIKLPRSLRYTDRASMRSSVEARLPLLDHEVVEKCFQIPSKFKFLFSQDRIIFKHLFKKNIASDLLFTNKKTIADPQTNWLKNSLSDLVFDTLNSKNFISKDIINNNIVLKYFERIRKAKTHQNTSFFIRILLFEWWRKTIANV